MKLLPSSGQPWNHRFLAVSFVAGIVFQLSMLLQIGLQGEPAWRHALVFALFDLGVIVRWRIAWIRAEIGRAWLFYSILCVFFVPLIAVVLYVLDVILTLRLAQ